MPPKKRKDREFEDVEVHEIDNRVLLLGGWLPEATGWLPTSRDLVTVGACRYLRIGKASQHLARLCGKALNKCLWLDLLIEARDAACSKALEDLLAAQEPVQVLLRLCLVRCI